MAKFIEELHEQYDLWINYMNYTMAPWIFALAVGCFLGDAPQWLTFCCIAFVCLWGYNNPNYPRNLIKLRGVRKEKRNADYLYRGFISKNMGIVAVLTKMYLFFISASFLAAVSVGITKSAVGL